MRVRLGLRLGLGGGSPSRSVHFSIVRNIRKVLALYEVNCPLYRLKTNKNTALCGGMPSLLRFTLPEPAHTQKNIAERKGEEKS
jgi:hypothetical protein